MFCRKCGSEVTGKYCSQCGTPIDDQHQDAVVDQPTPQAPEFKQGFFARLKALKEFDKEIALRQQEIENLRQKSAETQSQIRREEFETQSKCAKIKAREQELLAEESQYKNRLLEAKLDFENENERFEKQIGAQSRKLNKIKTIYQSVAYAVEHFISSDENSKSTLLQSSYADEFDLNPTVHLKLHNEDLKDLRKLFRDNEKVIDELLIKYEGRYTTKANATIYRLMVIALRAELQNILYSLKYERLEKSIESIKTVTRKYLGIAQNANQSIAGTMTRFIGEIEYLFINAANIEYEYYVRKERIKDEQRALREQMRQEAEERRILEEQRKQVEKEESKYKNEMDSIRRVAAEAVDEEKRNSLLARIKELEDLLAGIEEKKEEIVRLQNGLAGYVYVISNLGSFGDNVFKVGMTRRLDPQERVNELGDASVPFPFDVHSFIFSENAVDLENKLHKVLAEKRVNKINARKEFFYSSVEELEAFVNDMEPSAEFNKTMLAEQYRQSTSLSARDALSLADTEEVDDDSDNE